jgi:septal ring factor EnvC (AmiA/AmiB activator)
MVRRVYGRRPTSGCSAAPCARRRRGRAAPVSMLIAATVVAVISFSWLAPANCAPAPSLAQQKAAAERRTAEVKQKLDALNKDLEEAIQQYDLANLQLAEVQSRIADVSQQLAVALSSLQAKQQELSECVVAMYEQRPTDILDVIFSSRNFDDLSQQLDSFRKLGLQSSEVVRQVQQYADTVKQMRDRLAEQRVRPQPPRSGARGETRARSPPGRCLRAIPRSSPSLRNIWACPTFMVPPTLASASTALA